MDNNKRPESMERITTQELAQAFIDEMPYSPRLDGIRQCIQEYIDGKTDIINSPDRW